jgi:hypothetical protein
MPEENGWVLPQDSSVPRVTKAIPASRVPRGTGVKRGLKVRAVNAALMVPWDQQVPKVTRAIPAFKALQGKKAKRGLLDFVVNVDLKAFRDCPVPRVTRVTRVIPESGVKAAGTTIKRKESTAGKPGLKSQISKVRKVIPDLQDPRVTEATGGTRETGETGEFQVKVAGMTTRRKGSTVREAPGFRLHF